MRPIRLTFSGLRSYRSIAVVDFEGLELFAIVGDTGAGKSTIIEALSLALYATKTWRGGSSKSDMIADGEATMRIELIFEADGHEWTVTRSWRRSGPGVNKLVRADKGESIDGSTAVTERITELLGLNHGQFTQAVVMPQGRFDELLRATPSDRSRLLASILGLDAVRRTGAEAARIRDEWQPTVDLALARRQVLPLDPAADLAEAGAEQVAADARVTQLRSAVEALGDHEARAGALAAAADRLGRALAAVPALDRDPVAELDEARTVGERLAERRRDLVAEQRELEAGVERLGEAATKTLAGFGARDDAVEARTGVRAASDGLRDDAATLDTERRRLADLEATPPPPDIDPALAAAVEAAASTLDGARIRSAAAEGAVAEARQRWLDLAAALAAHDAATAARSTAVDRLETASREAAERTAALDAAVVDLAAAQGAEADALAADAAAAASAACEPGDDCPVCRRPLPDDFTPPPAGALDAARSRTAAARSVADAARDAASASARDEAHARQAVEQAEATVAETRSVAVAAEQAARAAGCDVTAGDETAAVVGVRAELDTATAATTAAEQEHQQAQAAASAARSEAVTARALHEQGLAAARSAVAQAERRVGAHREVAGRLPEAWRPAEPVTAEVLAEVAAEIDTMLTALDAIDHERNLAEAARATLAASIAEIEATARHEVTRSVESALAVLNERLGRIRDAVRAAADTPPPSLPAAADPDLVEPPVLPDTARTAELAALIASAWEALAVADRALGAVEATAERVRVEHDQIGTHLRATLDAVGCATAAQLHTEAGAARERATSAADRVAAAHRAVAAAEDLDRFLAEARPFVANLSVLAVALRDQHFVGHLVKAREVELIAEANRRLRAITRDRFGFVGDFGVVSVASGEIRSPDALSGGERFQAALALALSLVEIASRGRGRLDAVFVDEGFGSLDTAALDSALDTLGLVAGGGKMVGLISHLKPVAEYVESVMLVTKDDVLGSTISLLDPDQRDRMLADDIRSGLTSG